MPAPAAAAATVAAARHGRTLLAGAASVLSTVALAVLGVLVLALGSTRDPSEVAASIGIGPIAMDAYQRAAASPTGQGCGLRWQILAAVARIESNHAAGTTIAENGTTSPPIIGIALDGTGGTASIPDTDDGRLDGDTTWDRAVGPFQFIPSSWAIFGVDGNGDGRADPHNLYDAALAAAGHLCPAGTNLADDTDLRSSLFSYNRSERYVADVLAWIAYYDNAEIAGPVGVVAPTGTLVTVRGIHVDTSIAADLEALLAAAEADGLTLGGGGWRSHERQIELRRSHCGTSHYAIWEMPASGCTPPTARPGTSKHEQGLAVDFTHQGRVVQHGTTAATWLATKAPRFGFRTLSCGCEPWHWER